MTNTLAPQALAAADLDLLPASGRIGVEIRGVDIAQPLAPKTVEAIRRALDTWKVVFFRDQTLDHAAQIRFGRQFGDLTYAILEVSPVESRWILQHLFGELIRPEYTVRFRWEPGSVAFWDNRATAHLGPQDLGHLDVERVLHRVTLIGEVPVGPDGRQSDLIEGVPFVSTPLFEPTEN